MHAPVLLTFCSPKAWAVLIPIESCGSVTLLCCTQDASASARWVELELSLIILLRLRRSELVIASSLNKWLQTHLIATYFIRIHDLLTILDLFDDFQDNCFSKIIC